MSPPNRPNIARKWGIRDGDKMKFNYRSFAGVTMVIRSGDEVNKPTLDPLTEVFSNSIRDILNLIYDLRGNFKTNFTI
jgi:hypothetical protein